MKPSTVKLVDELMLRYPALMGIRSDIDAVIHILVDSFESGGKLLICGNGGSAADAMHIVGELMKDFVLPRPLPNAIVKAIEGAGKYAEYINTNLQMPLPAIALVGSVSFDSAYANDRVSDLTFAQQVLGLGNKSDVLLGISTSGNSKNVIYAMQVAKAKGLFTIGLTGINGGELQDIADFLIKVPESETFKIQELHLPIYHAICLAVENEFFGE